TVPHPNLTILDGYRAYNIAMRSFLAATFVAMLAIAPVTAQRGGGHGFAGHAGFGGRAGFAGHSSFHSSGGISHGGFSAHQSYSYGGFGNFHGGHRSGFTYSRSPGNRFRGPRIRSFRNGCFGFSCGYYGYPWVYGGYYDPYWWWDSGSSYDEDY